MTDTTAPARTASGRFARRAQLAPMHFTATRTATTEDTAMLTAPAAVTVAIGGVDVTITPRTLPAADGDGRLMARYDSHSRVYGADALVPALAAALAAETPGTPEWKGARAVVQYRAPRALRALLRDLRAHVDGRQDRVLVEGAPRFSVTGGHGDSGPAHVLAGTVRLDGVSVDFTVAAEPGGEHVGDAIVVRDLDAEWAALTGGTMDAPVA